jgi:ferredoxin-NADP reductase/MOSC domain-containing protein YiiM
MASIVSINVGRPRAIMWRGKTIETAIFKQPIAGRTSVRKTNIDGDAQADLVGHGGEQRAVFVYQMESHRYWAAHLGRAPFSPGMFGENLTVDGLPDNEVCIGDRFRAGSVLFEVSQPRVTCFKVGVKLNCPEIPALLVAHHRPGFYFRVIEEGEIGAGDRIEKVLAGPEGLTVAATDALLYSPNHDADTLRRALRIAALSPGWQGSFQALLAAAETGARAGNAGLVASRPALAWEGYRPLKVATSHLESTGIRSFELVDPAGGNLPAASPGQYVGIRIVQPTGVRVSRSYSLCGAPGGSSYRIAVKNERGAASGFMHDHVRSGDLIEVGAPRGTFILRPGTRAIVLMSAGVGLTPLLAMLHAAVRSSGISARSLWWIHSTHDGASHAFAREVGQLVGEYSPAKSVVFYSQPAARDRPGVNFDIEGRIDLSLLKRMGLPRDAEFYMCGPQAYLDELRSGLQQWGVPPDQINEEAFGPKKRPDARPPHLPEGPAGSGPAVTFTRSGLTVSWRDGDNSLLELAEECSVPTDWSCRTGVCHRCESGLISGEVTYNPEPLDPPAVGSILLCCAVPRTEVEIDL